jgi:hypothetical protein
VYATQGQWCVTCARCHVHPETAHLRYRRRYGMSMIENDPYISEHGRTAWEQREVEKWRCPTCGCSGAHTVPLPRVWATNSHTALRTDHEQTVSAKEIESMRVCIDSDVR